MAKLVLIGIVATLPAALALAFQNTGVSQPIVMPDISFYGMLAIAATWIGVWFGFMNQKRQIMKDLEDRMQQIAEKCAKMEMDKRAPTFMSRDLQMEINKQTDQKFMLLVGIEKLAMEVNDFARTIMNLAVNRMNNPNAK